MQKYLLFFTFLFSHPLLFSQDISWELISPMPERVTNNALAEATVDGVPYVYSFGGIDSTKACGNQHLRAFRYNTQTDIWESIAPLPDDLGGKIAVGASTVNNKIYIIGGYHIDNNCNEISSKKVHVYDPETNSYLADGAEIPVAIDDQVQAIWRDSLIFVVTGWSDNTNVRDVQIYNPSTDEWMAGTEIPNTSQWRVFGASGVIIDDVIYYNGGASRTCNSISCFAATDEFRKGIINPNNPTEITWSAVEDPAAIGYRMAATTYQGKALWFGGSSITYNFDGIDYNGTGGVPPLDRVSIFDPQINFLHEEFGLIPPIMDLRGIARVSENEYIIAGGMEANQFVTNKAIKIIINDLTSTEKTNLPNVQVYPNPFINQVQVNKAGSFEVEIMGINGQILVQQTASEQANLELQKLPSGTYMLRVLEKNQLVYVEKLIKP